MKILVRLPNWLGDLVMSTGFINALLKIEPSCTIDIIVKDSLVGCIPLIEGINHILPFSRAKYPGISGNIRFGRKCASHNHYDRYFTLPDSFSSALHGYFSGCTQRIGYAAQFRSPLLTHTYNKPSGIHRAQEFVSLLRLYYSQSDLECTISLKHIHSEKDTFCSTINAAPGPKILFNMHSAAASRKVPVQKASAIGKKLIQALDCTLIFTGAPTDIQRSKTIISELNIPDRCIDLTGITALSGLSSVCSLSDIVISTDSGVAHFANALKRPVLVLFGAGNENNTAPFNKEYLSIIRASGIVCAPCVKNECRYKHHNCMNNLNEQLIIQKTVETLECSAC